MAKAIAAILERMTVLPECCCSCLWLPASGRPLNIGYSRIACSQCDITFRTCEKKAAIQPNVCRPMRPLRRFASAGICAPPRHKKGETRFPYLARGGQHALQDAVAPDKIMIERARNMQRDKTQQHIDQDVVNAARLMGPGRSLRRQC